MFAVLITVYSVFTVSSSLCCVICCFTIHLMLKRFLNLISSPKCGLSDPCILGKCGHKLDVIKIIRLSFLLFCTFVVGGAGLCVVCLFVFGGPEGMERRQGTIPCLLYMQPY